MILFPTIRGAVLFLLAVLCGQSAFAKAPRFEVRFEADTLTPFARSAQLLDGVLSTLHDPKGTVTIRGFVDSSQAMNDRTYLFEQRARLIEGMLKEWMDQNPGWRYAPAILSDQFSNHSGSFDPNVDDMMIMEVEFRESITPRRNLIVRGLSNKRSKKDNYRSLGNTVILYHASSTKLYPGGERELSAAVDERANEKIFVKVTGYAEPTGNAERNAQISRARVEGVVNYLQSLGVETNHFLKVEAIAGPTAERGRVPLSYGPSRRVVVEFVSEQDFKDEEEILYEAVPCPPVQVERIRVRDSERDHGWLGHFGLAQAFDYYSFMISLERKVGDYFSLSVTAFEQASLRAGYAGRARSLAGGVGFNVYSEPDFKGIWLRFAAVVQMASMNSNGTTADFLTGVRVNAGYVLSPDFPFRLRLSGGMQSLNEGPNKNIFGGVSPFIQIELGVPW